MSHLGPAPSCLTALPVLRGSREVGEGSGGVQSLQNWVIQEKNDFYDKNARTAEDMIDLE